MSLLLLIAVIAVHLYRPTRWCVNRACHQAIPADAPRCPHCHTEQPLAAAPRPRRTL